MVGMPNITQPRPQRMPCKAKPSCINGNASTRRTLLVMRQGMSINITVKLMVNGYCWERLVIYDL
jgi:hypothetical protein